MNVPSACFLGALAGFLLGYLLRGLERSLRASLPRFGKMRFGQALVCALVREGHFKQHSRAFPDGTSRVVYEVSGQDLFSIPDDLLESILREFADEKSLG